MRFHFTDKGAMHRGFEAECKRCLRIRLKREAYRKSREGKVDGRTLNRKYPPKYCCNCRVEIEGRNKTGMCIICFNLYKAKLKRHKQEAYRKEGMRCTCGTVLNPRNISGLCKYCYEKSGLNGYKIRGTVHQVEAECG